MEKLTRWQDPTTDDLIKENLELKRKLGEADDTVEYWQTECDKRSKILDKIKEYINRTEINSVGKPLAYTEIGKELLEILEEIE